MLSVIELAPTKLGNHLCIVRCAVHDVCWDLEGLKQGGTAVESSSNDAVILFSLFCVCFPIFFPFDVLEWFLISNPIF